MMIWSRSTANACSDVLFFCHRMEITSKTQKRAKNPEENPFHLQKVHFIHEYTYIYI